MLQFLLDHQGVALAMLTSFGGGALAHRIGLILGWFKSPQGQAIEGDIKAAVPIVLKTLADSGHPASPAAISTILAVTNDLPEPAAPTAIGSKVLGLVLAFLLAASVLRADAAPVAPIAGWCAGPSVWAGSALYQTNPEGTLDPAQSALAGLQFAAYLGSWSGQSFSPTYTLGILAAMRTQGGVNTPALGINGGFYLDGVPLTAFVAKDMATDGGGLLWGVGTSVKFNDFVPFLYLGHPGN